MCAPRRVESGSAEINLEAQSLRNYLRYKAMSKWLPPYAKHLEEFQSPGNRYNVGGGVLGKVRTVNSVQLKRLNNRRENILVFLNNLFAVIT